LMKFWTEVWLGSRVVSAVVVALYITMRSLGALWQEQQNVMFLINK
jgi:hypothetical protein